MSACREKEHMLVCKHHWCLNCLSVLSGHEQTGVLTDLMEAETQRC